MSPRKPIDNSGIINLVDAPLCSGECFTEPIELVTAIFPLDESSEDGNCLEAGDVA
jgi:hypothetical protein